MRPACLPQHRGHLCALLPQYCSFTAKGCLWPRADLMTVSSDICRVAGRCGTWAEGTPPFCVQGSEWEGGGAQWEAPSSIPMGHSTNVRCQMGTPSSWPLPPALYCCLPAAGAALYGVKWKERGSEESSQHWAKTTPHISWSLLPLAFLVKIPFSSWKSTDSYSCWQMSCSKTQRFILCQQVWIFCSVRGDAWGLRWHLLSEAALSCGTGQFWAGLRGERMREKPNTPLGSAVA